MLRALIPVAGYWPLLLIGAEEIFLLALLQTWLIGSLISLLRGRTGSGSIQAPDTPKSKHRFSIGTMLFVTGAAAGFVVLWKVMPALNAAAWISLACCGTAVVSFAVCGWLMVNLAWRWYWRIPLALLIALVFATLPALFDWLFWSLFHEELFWPPDVSAMGIFFVPEDKPTFEWYLLGATVTIYLAIVLLVVVRLPKQRRLSGILTLVLVVLPAMLPSWTLYKLLTPPELVSLETSDNAYLAVMELGSRISKSHNAIQDYSGQLGELRELLKRPIAVPIHRDFDDIMDELTNVREVARAIAARGDSQIATSKIDEALDDYLLEIRYGIGIRRGGLLIHMLLGVACSGGGIEPLYRYRVGCSATKSKNIVDDLIRLSEQLEPGEVFAERDRAWSIQQGWHPHLQHLMLEFADAPLARMDMYQAAAKRELAELRLLATEYAITRYLEDKGTLPSKLDDLIPVYLPRQLEDPFSLDGQAFQYKMTETAFILYSLGSNGVDDGGRGPTEFAGYVYQPCDLSLKHVSELMMQPESLSQVSEPGESEEYAPNTDEEPLMDTDER
jgi:hypothetical protein